MKEFVNKVLTETKRLYSVEAMVKASEYNKALYNAMKKQTIAENKANASNYGLRLDMTEFEAYFSKSDKCIVRVFKTKDKHIVAYVDDEFFVDEVSNYE